MASEAAKVTLVLFAVAAGVGLCALPWLPQTRPNPLPAQFALASPAGRGLLSVLQWHDEACMQGDLDGFRDRVTQDYARGFARRLQQLGRPLDAAALSAYVGKNGSLGLAPSVQRDCRGGWSAGDRACLVIGAPGGQHGVQGITFRWDGANFRLDGVEHQPAVAGADARAVAAFAQRLVSAP